MLGASSNINQSGAGHRAIAIAFAGIIARVAYTTSRAVALTLSFTFLLLASYVVLWALLYRLPPTPPIVTDRRVSQSERPYFVTFCAGLASNTIGFPGHAYVVWTPELPTDLSSGESAGYVPCRYLDQMPSLWTHVTGQISNHCTSGNMRNLSFLTVIVNRADYEKTRLTCNTWKTDKFQAGVRDCVAFSNEIASELGLKTPHTIYKYPQDYLRELKQLNSMR
jgi:hypothetical protein